ncbi:RNA exonuclease 3 [Cladobotryum mycophilum]|uniref:RNA exonuclease 3 n=1 Tax=Cladobotryum mycophilum TaxID=491253 RepID=A0ABR0SRD2_9HYPO
MYQLLDELPPTLECGGNTYTQLTNEQQSDIYEELLRRCHSLEIIQRERIILDIEPLPVSIAKKPGLGIGDFITTPKRKPTIERRKVVAIDCEWGISQDRRNEPISICAIDFLTGETLIDSLIAPSRPISDWRSRIHGITAETIEVIVGGYECLQGWKEARAKLLEYVDYQTILIGHTIRIDLELLRMFHRTIIDSQVLATDAVFKNVKKRPGYKWPIDKVCEGFLGISIRKDATLENKLHDTLENVLASREIVLQCIQRPQDLEEWGKQERGEFWRPKEEKKRTKAIHVAGGTADQIDHPVAGSTEEQMSNQMAEQWPSKQEGRVACARQLADHMSDGNEHPIAYYNGYDAGYQAAYQAAFQSGFHIGYERGCQKVNTEMNQPWTKYRDQDEDQYEDQDNTQNANRHTYQKEALGGRKNNPKWNENSQLNGITQVRSLIDQLLKDMRNGDMTRGTKQCENQDAMIKANQAEDEVTKVPRHYVDDNEEREMILQLCRIAISEARPKRNLNANEKALRKAQKKARKQAKREAKNKKKRERNMKKSREEAERKAMMNVQPAETQIVAGPASWGLKSWPKRKRG